MTLHPIAAVEHVLREYRSDLSTEFRASDPKLREALQRALDEPRFLAQEPFFQAHRPFEDGARWRELPIDARLAREWAYPHQSDAIAHLLSAAPSALVRAWRRRSFSTT